MLVLYCLMIIAGLAAMIFGGKWVLKSNFGKTLLEFPLADKMHSINFMKEGNYALCINKAGFAKNIGKFELIIISEIDNKSIVTKENRVKYSFLKNGNMSIELLNFEIKNPGNYSIQLKNASDLLMKQKGN